MALVLLVGSAWPTIVHAQFEAAQGERAVATTRFRATLEVPDLKVWVRAADGEAETCATPCELRLVAGMRYELAASLPGSDRRPRARSFIAGEETPELVLYYEDASRTRASGTHVMQFGFITGALGGSIGLAVGMGLGNLTVQVASLLSGAVLLLLGVVGNLMRGAPDALNAFTIRER